MPDLSKFQRAKVSSEGASVAFEALCRIRDEEKNIVLANPYRDNLYDVLFVVYENIPIIRLAFPNAKTARKEIAKWANRNPFESKPAEVPRRGSSVDAFTLAAGSRVDAKTRSRWVRALKQMPPNLTQAEFRKMLVSSGGVSGLARQSAASRSQRRKGFRRNRPGFGLHPYTN